MIVLSNETALSPQRLVGKSADSLVLKIIPRGNPLDTICATLEQKMQYAEGERDLVL